MVETAKKKGKVQRLSDWEDARYSIIPADAPRDPKLKLVHLRLLGEIGRVNTQRGWCEFSQKEYADQQGINRSAASTAINDLVRWRYVEMLGQKKTKSSLCQYRVLIDDPYFEAEAEHQLRCPPPEGGEVLDESNTPVDEDVLDGSNTPLGDGVLAEDNTPQKEGCRPEPTPVSATDNTSVGQGQQGRNKNARATRSKIKDHPPHTPQGGRGAKAALLNDLKEEGQPQHVIDHFLGRLLGAGLRPWKDVSDPVGPGREICRAASIYSVDVLSTAASELLKVYKHRLPPVADCLSALTDAAAAEERRLTDHVVRRRSASEARKLAALEHEQRVRNTVVDALKALSPEDKKLLSAAFAATLDETDRLVFGKFGWHAVALKARPFLEARLGTVFPENEPAKPTDQGEVAA